MEYQTLIYQTKRKLPNVVWDEEKIEILLEMVDKSDRYISNLKGQWRKARDKLIIAFMFSHALRPKEALCVKFGDFNLEEKTIFINGGNNKTKKDRVIPINSKIAILFMEYLSFPRSFWQGSEYLFPSRSNDFLSSSTWKQVFREKVLKPAGIWQKPEKSGSSKTRSYTLRHSKATELINKTDIFTVANILGHSDISSTKVYLHMNKKIFSAMRKAINS